MKNLKKILLITAIVLSTTCVFSQAKVSSMNIDKVSKDAVMIQMDYPESFMKDVLEQRFKDAGLSGKSERGIIIYKEVVYPDIAPDKVDIYTKVEKDSRNSSNVYITVSKGYNNFINQQADTMIFNNLITFLNSLVKDAQIHAYDIDIINKQKDLEKENKKYEGLIGDQKDLQKQKEKIEKQLDDIAKDIKSKKEDISGMEKALNELKSKKDNLKK